METNFTILSKYLKKILEQDENSYVLFADGLEHYILKDYKKTCSKNILKRIINIGISEQNAISMAAGLGLSGKTPYVVMFGPFMVMRAAEQIKLDVCYTNANVKLIATNTGFAGTFGGGYSHCLIEDIAMLSAMPNIQIYSPSPDKNEFEAILNYAHNHKGADYIRLNCAHAPAEKRLHYNIELNKIISNKKKLENDLERYIKQFNELKKFLVNIIGEKNDININDVDLDKFYVSD